MVPATTIVMACVIFCMGIVLGLMCHLPWVLSPSALDPDRSHVLDRVRRVAMYNDSRTIHHSRRQNESKPINMQLPEDIELDSIINFNSLEGSQQQNHNHELQKSTTSEQTRQKFMHIPGGDAATDGSGSNVEREANAILGHDWLKIDNSIKNVPRRSVLSNGQYNWITDGIYWSVISERLAPKKFDDDEVGRWRNLLNNSKIIDMLPGCGRMQNRQLVLGDGSKACARYRVNSDQIQGEIYSFYLSRLLGINHVPPSVLIVSSPRDDRWLGVRNAISTAKWSSDKVLIATPWIYNLKPAPIPNEFQPESRRLHPVDVVNIPSDRIPELVQWSDLIIFDYLTANLDRVVNNMYNYQWNPDMMSSPAHNLERDPDTGLLVFLDNESGLFHSYRLLDKYDHYHKDLLKSLCVFRRTTADKIRDLVKSGNVRSEIMDLFNNEEPLSSKLQKLPEKTTLVLIQRIQDVAAQINWCETHSNR